MQCNLYRFRTELTLRKRFAELLSRKAIHLLEFVLQGNATLLELQQFSKARQYLGLSKLALETASVKPLFNNIGRFLLEGDVEERQKDLKARDAIVEKNKKLKT